MKKKLLNKKIKLLDIEILKNKKGDILKIFNGKSKIRECYISYVNKDTIKAWRYHRISEQKIFLLSGKCLAVVYFKKKFYNFVLSEKINKILIIPNKCWYGFKNIGSKKVKLLNLINVNYSEHEIQRKNIKDIGYDWKKR